MRLTKGQVSLRIRVVWLEYSLGAFWITKMQSFFKWPTKTDQTERMYRLIRDFGGRTCQKARFLTLRLKSYPREPQYRN